MCDNEKLFAVFVLMIACGVFAILVGLMGSIFDKGDALVSDFSEKILLIDTFLIKNNIGVGFREKVRMYLYFLAVMIRININMLIGKQEIVQA
jgi:hypothetical protein